MFTRPLVFLSLFLVSLVCAVATAFAGPQCFDMPQPAEIGVRPFYLVDDMDDGELKQELAACAQERRGYFRTDFSIGHRGACLEFPEHTRESYLAAARMGAGVIECDVTFTKDKELVCRHSQCDLATTTNILAIPELAAKCSEPFSPAEFDAAGELVKPASAKCCTSDITLAEFKTLKGKMDGANPRAATVAEYMDGTPDYRTDLYDGPGTLMTHAESIELFKELGVKMTPELKSASVAMPFDGYTQEAYAQQMIDEYKKAGVDPGQVFAQSFNLDDVRYWLAHEPRFGNQAVYLDDRDEEKSFDIQNPATWSPSMTELYRQNVRIIAPPIWVLLVVKDGKLVPSEYAKAAKAAGLEIITWSLERDAPLSGGGGWYHQTMKGFVNNDGDVLTVLDALAQDVGILGIFSDWPATATFYANCKGIK